MAFLARTHARLGGPAWQQLPLGDERSQDLSLEMTADMRNGRDTEQRRSGTSLAAAKAGESGVQVRRKSKHFRRRTVKENVRRSRV